MAKTFMLTKTFEPEEAFEHLKTNLRSTKISNITYDPTMKKIEITGNYYTYQLMFVSNQLSITPKIIQKWLIVMLICIISGFFLIVPFIAMVIFAIVIHSEIKEVYALVYQTLNMA